MESPFIAILIAAFCYIIPVLISKRKKDGRVIGQILDQLEEIKEIPQEEDEQEDILESEQAEVVEAVEEPVLEKVAASPLQEPEQKPVLEEKANLEERAKMSPEEKRKLVVYSEIMSPKYKEY